MIVDDFLCWVDAAKTPDRAKAASALVRAYVQEKFDASERGPAEMAIACLLDDPSANVRLEVARALADAPCAPRAIILSLCDDQLEIACTIITQSPVLNDDDLVDLAVNGDSATRAMIASRAKISKSVSAAICEIGNAPELLQLLQNPGVELTGTALKRVAERMGGNAYIRGLLLERADLSATARHLLVGKVSDVLASSALVRSTQGAKRAGEIVREAQEGAMTIVAGHPEKRDLADFVEHLRERGELTPAFLMRALCAGHAEFFAEVLSNLSGVTSRRVRAILSEGRAHAVRALMESAGFTREVSPLYVQCILLWRKQAAGSAADTNVAQALVEWARKHKDFGPAAQKLLDLAERIGIDQMRQSARQYAARVTLQAA